MNDALPVTIGGLYLTGAEVPTFFDRTSDVRVAIVRVIGGDRVVQILGTAPRRRSITGYLVGTTAVDRAQALEAMRDSGAPVVLAIGAWTELVLITSVTIRYADRGVVMHYALEAEALPSSLPATVTTSADAVGSSLSDLAQSALILAGSSGAHPAFAAVGSDLAQAEISVSSSYGTEGQTFANLLSPSTALSELAGQYGEILTSSSGGVQGSSLVANSSDLTSAAAAALSLALAARSGAFLNRASLTLANLSGRPYLPTFHS